MVMDGEWSIRFAIMCWLLWKRRYRILLEPEVGVLEDVLTQGNRLVMECSRATNDRQVTGTASVMLQRWSNLPIGWIKLNVDASGGGPSCETGSFYTYGTVQMASSSSGYREFDSGGEAGGFHGGCYAFSSGVTSCPGWDWMILAWLQF
ncbi:hypothetical protein V6N11_004514 [Hibiscus sabdariffa]|uniref:Uncharacterized protein n=1 Tax=Hibiscus sabdariffa TaxID=183260 RepID=A0ABR2SGS9_9ROSI